MTPYRIKKIFDQFKKKNPNPVTELHFNSPFECLIAVMLSAQATDVSVNKATKRLFQQANTPQKIIKLGEEKLQDHIKSIGLYRSKAKNIIKTCLILNEKYCKHPHHIPNNRQELEALPGVGRKTANVILNVVFKESTLAVDTHIFRVSQRIGLAQGSTPLAIEKQLLKCIPKAYLLHAHHWLILHGRYTCIARKPKCNLCDIAQYCEHKHRASDQQSK